VVALPDLLAGEADPRLLAGALPRPLIRRFVSIEGKLGWVPPLIDSFHTPRNSSYVANRPHEVEPIFNGPTAQAGPVRARAGGSHQDPDAPFTLASGRLARDAVPSGNGDYQVRTA